MTGNPRERWQLLCEQAAKEPNSAKLLAMVREINDLIDAKYRPRAPPFGAGRGLYLEPAQYGSGLYSGSPRNFSSLTSPKICAVTQPPSGETQ